MWDDERHDDRLPGTGRRVLTAMEHAPRCRPHQTERLRELIDTVDAQISRWENGRALPEVEALEAMAEALGILPEVFFRDEA